MGSKSYGYTVRTERLRVLGATELLACLLLIIVVCWLAFPRDLAITLRNARLDAVTLSYMQAWLKAKPDDHELRLLMARELIVLGRFDEADVQLDRVEAADAGYQSQVRWLRLQWDFKRLMAMEPELRDASRLQAETLASLRSQNWSTLNGDQRRELAEMTLVLGEVEQAVRYYRLIATEAEHPGDWYEKAGRVLLGQGNYLASGLAYGQAMAASGDPAARKQYFLEALASLEAGSLHDEALRFASRYEHLYYRDKDVLYRLMRLAQAGGNLTQAQRYAVRLLGLNGQGVQR
ncbi:MAG: tetratricopeptide repeat protein [Alcanivorax sp.]|jgi:tetratricopeptide (TPR) repeat protein|uniref:tetratricopeptide repeat protein n=1 Tax=Alcanivorax sp. TaxID=1872427 RepID=UPI0019964D81|nr:tetratricopeptide repeat protein [Alcanivorax sp.]MBD3642686.1 tetratricopeptide repeat protein [Alcanivorax sp.]MDF1725157.1 tetratricopeptide repeat protein [Alcanivorax sp.]